MSQKALLLTSLVMAAAIASACVQPAIPTPPPLLTLPPVGTQTNPLFLSPSAPPGSPQPDQRETPAMMATATFDPQIAEEAALDALSRELNIPPSEISVISTLPHEWNDASLGCPQPGQVYPPVLTPGYQITLAAGDRTYQVHTDISGTAIVCFTEESDEGGAVADPLVAEFIAEAKAQLAEELGIAEGSIALVRSEAVDWSDSSLGCAEPGQTYAQVMTPGYRIVLAVDETRYEYHADQQRMFLCTAPTQ